MSTPNSRRPSAPGITIPQSLRSCSSFSVEPKSEFLRSALEARRAKDIATPSPAESRPTPKRIVTSFTPTSDPWLDQALSEEDAPRATPIRRPRRPSEGALPRMPTQRELQTETEALKNNMFNLNLKLELLKKQNNELKDALDEANKRIEDLEPLEDENYDLRDDNNRLKLRMQDLEEENIQLNDANAEILKIQDETIANLEKQHSALDEAADMIYQLEKEKEEMTKTNAQLADQVAACQQFEDTLDGPSSDRFPGRIQSIDDSRPSTSHFDSDYYSQPGSPQVKVKTSRDLPQCSERAKNFFEMNLNGKKSVKELKQRVSDASIRHKARPRSPVPEVPQIPEGYEGVDRVARPQKEAVHTPTRRHRIVPPPQPALNTVGLSPAKSSSTAPRTPTGPKEGLRRMFKEGRVVERSRPPSNHPSPTLSHKASIYSALPSPSQTSVTSLPSTDNHIPQLSSGERLRGSSSADALHSTPAPPEISYPVPPSVTTDDLTSEVDYREKWWKDVRNVYPHNRGAAESTHATRPSGGSGMQRDFFFNGAENEDQFMRRAQGYMPRRK
ncbi:hypothetical protein BU24DRAFT_84875 [Aaosphaeria arxii CBS 175.79]|uniref:Centrosomin N-terminal motif 1 domain-containing protein n=1 Tax=Aaosphaeria arxii CBS 175.79 TaxID=1450172 RepID=A0A6A5X8E4_9PLEO|nr:uncharacterized protein BU24DRAFT_84875 [Aaosphaeria arxii CBS 175.79]KAF2009213.1 hypothetical protein BU24DRAFT_84875 [Aaosphaeria arxii CBS 175.79]